MNILRRSGPMWTTSVSPSSLSASPSAPRPTEHVSPASSQLMAAAGESAACVERALQATSSGSSTRILQRPGPLLPGSLHAQQRPSNSRSDGVKSGNGYSQRVPATPERRNGCQPSPKDHAGRLGGSPRQLNVFACKPASIGAFTPPPLSSSSSSPEPPGRPGHRPVPPSPTQMDLAGPSCPLWSLWPASARSSAHRSTRAGHHEHVVRLQRAGWGGGAGSSSRGTGRGLGQRPAGRCGGWGSAGFSRPRHLAAARFPAVLCRAARARPQLGRSSESARGFELPPPPANWGGCWRRPRWPRTWPQWCRGLRFGPSSLEGALRAHGNRSKWPRGAPEFAHKCHKV